MARAKAGGHAVEGSFLRDKRLERIVELVDHLFGIENDEDAAVFFLQVHQKIGNFRDGHSSLHRWRDNSGSLKLSEKALIIRHQIGLRRKNQGVFHLGKGRLCRCAQNNRAVKQARECVQRQIEQAGVLQGQCLHLIQQKYRTGQCRKAADILQGRCEQGVEQLNHGGANHRFPSPALTAGKPLFLLTLFILLKQDIGMMLQNMLLPKCLTNMVCVLVNDGLVGSKVKQALDVQPLGHLEAKPQRRVGFPSSRWHTEAVDTCRKGLSRLQASIGNLLPQQVDGALRLQGFDKPLHPLCKQIPVSLSLLIRGRCRQRDAIHKAGRIDAVGVPQSTQEKPLDQPQAKQLRICALFRPHFFRQDELCSFFNAREFLTRLSEKLFYFFLTAAF